MDLVGGVERSSTARLRRRRLGCEDDGNLGADEPVGAKSAPWLLESSCRLPLMIFSAIINVAAGFLPFRWLVLDARFRPGCLFLRERGLVRFGGGGLELWLVVSSSGVSPTVPAYG